MHTCACSTELTLSSFQKSCVTVTTQGKQMAAMGSHMLPNNLTSSSTFCLSFLTVGLKSQARRLRGFVTCSQKPSFLQDNAALGNAGEPNAQISSPPPHFKTVQFTLRLARFKTKNFYSIHMQEDNIKSLHLYLFH